MERNVWEKDAKGWKISQLNCDNFCRNPGGSQRAPFCWVKEGFPGPKFGFCDVPDCVSRHEHRFISNQFRSRPLLKWTCKWSL